jgi:hypothetical protein
MSETMSDDCGDVTKEHAFHWFMRGFRQSREGFNAEYAASHLNPGIDRPMRPVDDALSEETIAELHELFEAEFDDTGDGR